MAYWLMKSEPSSYSWADLVRDGGTMWDGVRNNAARLVIDCDRDAIRFVGQRRTGAKFVDQRVKRPAIGLQEVCFLCDVRCDANH